MQGREGYGTKSALVMGGEGHGYALPHTLHTPPTCVAVCTQLLSPAAAAPHRLHGKQPQLAGLLAVYTDLETGSGTGRGSPRAEHVRWHARLSAVNLSRR